MKTISRYLTASAVMLAAAMTLGCAHTEAEPAVVASPATSAVQDLAGVVVPVSDLAAAEAFYQDVLGAVFVRRSETKTYKEAIYGLPAGDGARLVLIQSLSGQSSLSHVRVIFNANDIDTVFARLAKHDAEVERQPTPIPGASGLRIGIAHDADNNTLEFIQR